MMLYLFIDILIITISLNWFITLGVYIYIYTCLSSHIICTMHRAYRLNGIRTLPRLKCLDSEFVIIKERPETETDEAFDYISNGTTMGHSKHTESATTLLDVTNTEQNLSHSHFQYITYQIRGLKFVHKSDHIKPENILIDVDPSISTGYAMGGILYDCIINKKIKILAKHESNLSIKNNNIKRDANDKSTLFLVAGCDTNNFTGKYIVSN